LFLQRKELLGIGKGYKDRCFQTRFGLSEEHIQNLGSQSRKTDRTDIGQRTYNINTQRLLRGCSMAQLWIERRVLLSFRRRSREQSILKDIIPISFQVFKLLLDSTP
jgi:hypothetical protein